MRLSPTKLQIKMLGTQVRVKMKLRKPSSIIQLFPLGAAYDVVKQKSC